MNALELKIKKAAQLYYSDGSSDITDEEFDALLDQLRAENPNSELLGIGHGYRVENDTTPGEKIKHKYGTAGSLDKCRTWKELSPSIRDSDVCCSLKLDGLSVVLYYKDNVLIRALTRGDGTTGIDITDKIIKIWPRHIISDDKFSGAIRGEILMTYDRFDDYLDKHPDMKNPRNTAAGIINSKTGEGIEYLTLIVYTIVGYDNHFDYMDNYLAMHDKLISWFGKLNVVYCSEELKLYSDVLDQTMAKLRSYWSGEFPSDGIVITASNMVCKDGEVIYDANAYKFPSEIKETEVVEVQWNMSKTRYAVPKIRIKPIELAGTTVEYCTGYNAEYIKNNCIGPGSIVTVEKRGEIIPNVQEVRTKSDTPSMITNCPDCGCELSWSGVNLVCKNPNCRNAKSKDVIVWFNKLVPTDGLGDTLILNFLDELDLDDISVESIMSSNHKLYEDTNSVQWNTFARTFNNLVHRDTKFKLVSAIEALNIPRLGSINALKLSTLGEYVKKMILIDGSELGQEFFDELASKFGSANANSCKENIGKFKRLAYIYDRIIWNSVEIKSKGKVAITGKLSVKRSDFEKELSSHGWSVGDISKDTKFLITDDPNSSSSKNVKADKLGINKITEKEFREKYLCVE